MIKITCDFNPATPLNEVVVVTMKAEAVFTEEVEAQLQNFQEYGFKEMLTRRLVDKLKAGMAKELKDETCND